MRKIIRKDSPPALEHDAKLAGKLAKTVDAAGTALAVPEAYQNFKQNCE
jgi:hypothetical protein